MGQRVFLAVFPPRGATFDSFNADAFHDIMMEARDALERLGPGYIERVVVIPRGEEVRKEWQPEADGVPHELTPSLEAARAFRQSFPVYVEGCMPLMREAEFGVHEAIGYAKAHQATGVIAWFPESHPSLTTSELESFIREHEHKEHQLGVVDSMALH